MKYVLAFCIALVSYTATGQALEMALVEGGDYVPLYGGAEGGSVSVSDFYMDITPVTHAEYLAFVKRFPKWQKSQVAPLFAEVNYLSSWEDDTTPDPALMNSPVNNVSWFAAKAYCECQGKRLPTVDEWEYAAMADADSRDARKDSLYNQRIIKSYEARSTHRKKTGTTPANFWGIKDLHGLVWEWTSDFNAIILPGESRKQNNSINLFCAAGSIGANDLMSYAAFMRYALRSSLKANFTLNNVGFRCVKDANNELR